MGVNHRRPVRVAMIGRLQILKKKKFGLRFVAVLAIMATVWLFYEDFLPIEEIEKWPEPVEGKPAGATPVIRPITAAGNISLLSAFRDPRRPDAITVLSIGHRDSFKPPLFCLLCRGKRILAAVPVSETKRMPSKDTGYYGHFVFCEVSDAATRAYVNQVGLSPSRVNHNFSTIPVHDISSQEPTSMSLASCVSPIFGNKYNEAHLTAWIEWQRMLGVSHFLIYNYSAPSSLDRVFRYYSKRGVIAVRQWNISSFPTDHHGSWPPAPDRLHYFAQIEAYNECLYFLTHRYRFVMFVDLDEVIIPYKHRRLTGLLKHYDSFHGRFVSFLFGTSRVLSGSPREPSTKSYELAKKEKVVFFMRSSSALFQTYPGKQIVRSSRVTRVAVHETVDFSGATTYRKVSFRMAKVLHYSDGGISQADTGTGYLHETRAVQFLRPLSYVTLRVLREMRRGAG